MLGNVLIYITAFMCICGSKAAINYQPVPPFSVNFLQQVSDFDNIVEPEYEGNAIQTRESVDEEKNDCPSGKCPRLVGDNNQDEIQQPSEEADIKRDLGDKYFEYEEADKRYERDFQAVQDEKEDKEDKEAEKEEALKITDPDFLEEQDKAKNVSAATKGLFEEIENPKLEEEQSEVCCNEDEKDEKSGKAVALVEDKSSKAKLGSGDFLEMHFYKKIPETGSLKLHHNKKPLVINLDPGRHKNHKSASPKKVNLIALLEKGDNRFVQVPAIKLKVVPESIKRRRSDRFEPFFVSDNQRILHHHVPQYFVNTKSRMRRKFNRFEKRSPSYDLSDNQYLRDANLLVENIKTSLKMGIGKSKRPEEDESGGLDNSHYQNSLNNNNKKAFKKEITEKAESNMNVEKDSDNDFTKHLVNNNNLVRNGDNMVYRDNLPRNVNSNGKTASTDNSQKNTISEEPAPKDYVMKSETNTNNLVPKKIESGPYSELNSFLAKSKYENLLRTRIALMKGAPNIIQNAK